MFIIFFVLIVTCLATVLIFGIFCPHVYIQPPISGKKQAAAHGGGLLRVQKRCYALQPIACRTNMTTVSTVITPIVAQVSTFHTRPLRLVPIM